MKSNVIALGPRGNKLEGVIKRAAELNGVVLAVDVIQEIVLVKLDKGSRIEYATWAFNNNDPQVADFYWGKYYSELIEAYAGYRERVEESFN